MLDKSSFQKLFKELYSVNPAQWNSLLTKAGKTQFSGKGKPYKITRQAFPSKPFKNLLSRDWGSYKSQGNKQDQFVSKPQSIRVNGMTLPEMRKTNMRNANADVTSVDSSAVDSFRYDPSKKNLTIKFVGGDKEYLYPEVPRNVVNGLYASPSKGAYVNAVISQYSDYSNPEVQKKIQENK